MRDDSKQATPEETLKNFRTMIEVFDRDLIQTIAQRVIVSREIGLLKKKQSMPIRDSSREAKLAEFHKKCVEDFDADPELIDSIFKLILEASRKSQI